MVNKKSGDADEFDIKIRLRAKKGTDKELSKVLTFLEERTLRHGVEFDFKAELERFLVDRYLVLALNADGADEATLNPYGHRAIGSFQGYIRAIEDAAGISVRLKREDRGGLSHENNRVEIDEIASNKDAAAATADADEAELERQKAINEQEKREISKRMDDMAAMFGYER